jgi:hypothetical protein
MEAIGLSETSATAKTATTTTKTAFFKIK